MTAEKIDPKKYDYVILSNVDLVVSENFFEELELISKDHNVGVIAPAIISIDTGADSNPKILRRPSKTRIQLMIIITYFYPLFFLYMKFRNCTYLFAKKFISKESCPTNKNGITMYAPHGAIVIFSNTYFTSGGSINYPMFLFGEEGFIGEECKKNNLLIKHCTQLKVWDKMHGSTSFLAFRFLSRQHRISYQYYLEHVFPK